MRYITVETDLGWCAVAHRGGGLWRSWTAAANAREALAALGLPGQACEEPDDELLRQAASYVRSLATGQRVELALPLDLRDHTEFGRAVLLACSRVPWGQVVSYGELARQAGRPRGARAVGQAMHRNPLSPFVPCHRVVGAGGELTGFGGGLALKARMLELESVKVEHGKTGKPRVVRRR